MKPIEEIFTIFLAHMEEEVPGFLTEAEVAQFDSYINAPPSKVDEKQLCIYLDTGNHSEADASERFMMQAQLPGVLNPLKHRGAIDKAIVSFDISDVNAVTLVFSVGTFYPGEIKDGGMSSFVIYEISISDELTDCRSITNY